MLHRFLAAHRQELIDRCRARVAGRRAPRASSEEVEHGIPRFMDQLMRMLGAPGAPHPGAADASLADGMDATAAQHGNELLQLEFPVDQVVHAYGDLCQSITQLAAERGTAIPVQEFGILNRTLDNAIAAAVTEYSRQRDLDRDRAESAALGQRLGTLAHEMRNHLNTTILAISAMKGGTIGFGGATAAALDRSLIAMRTLIDRTLADVRLEEGTPPAREPIELAAFVAELQVAAALEASTRDCEFTVLPVEPGIFIEGDRHILAAAASNLLQNAFKFTRPKGHVVLHAHATADRVMIDIRDECGGIPAETMTVMFKPFQQRNADRSGVGLGLTISREGVEASGGRLYAKSLPGEGCIFTIEMPRRRAP